MIYRINNQPLLIICNINCNTDVEYNPALGLYQKSKKIKETICCQRFTQTLTIVPLDTVLIKSTVAFKSIARSFIPINP